MTARSNYIGSGSGRRSILDQLTGALGARDPRHVFIGGILILALLAFELFNFDTTRYALTNLLGEVAFLGIGWASILAIAFCAIDFAGLARLFTPERGRNEPKAVWYLMGAWLLGATMNAVMTWWAVSLTLLNHNLGNEVLGREELLQFVPIFVAVLVWLTRILFIGSLTVAGEQLFDFQSANQNAVTSRPSQSRPVPARPAQATKNSRPNPPANRPANGRVKRPAAAMVGFSGAPQRDASFYAAPSGEAPTQVNQNPVRDSAGQPTTRVRRRPPVMGGYGSMGPSGSGRSMQAKGHD